MLLNLLLTIIVIYIIICGLLYFFQEKMIFFPEKLEKDYQFRFSQDFEEVYIKVEDKVSLHALLFKSNSPKGVIFYLHGNAGSLDSWGEVAKVYTDMNYDVFLLDYRGFGKSGGVIKSEKQLHADVQTAYDKLKESYSESKIIVLGYSIGTGPATKVAASNSPKLLILQTPFYSLTDLMKQHYPVIPTFLLRYRFDNYAHVKACKMPILIFHGNRDEIIPYNSSLKLKQALKVEDTLITLDGQGHNGVSNHPEYIRVLRKILSE